MLDKEEEQFNMSSNSLSLRFSQRKNSKIDAHERSMRSMRSIKSIGLLPTEKSIGFVSPRSNLSSSRGVLG